MQRSGCLSAVLLAAVAWLVPGPVLAAPVQFATRAETIRAAREQKRSTAQPERVSTAEARLNALEDHKVLERLAFGYHGLTLVLGGLENGQGFALGPQYRRTDFADGDVNIRTSARYGFAGAWFGDAVLALPGLADDRVFFEAGARYRNYPRMDYYGDGPESRLADEARYRLEDSWIGASIGVRPAGPLSLGIEAGMLFVNTGDGSAGAGEGPGIGEVFDPVAVPGALIQTDFFRGAVFARYDDRDDSLGARDGGRYTARFSYFDDRHLGAHDFRQLDLEARRYLPFFNKRRVFVLRLKTAMTFANGSAAVPFYLQPVLGGSDDLRGYLPFRFYGDNLIVGNIEYRWESFSGLDMAVFFDAGKVAPTPSEIDFRGMETSVGFGFRFNVRNATFIRLDTGFSHEGTQFWFKFADPF